MNNKIRVLGIAPYEGMQFLMQKAALKFPQIELNAMVGDLENGVEAAQNNFHADYDVIVSRGGTAKLLRQKVDLPVVEIPITEYDILRALHLVENVADTFAIVGFSNITENALHLSEILSVEPKLFTINHAEEVADTIELVWNEGYRTVLCDVIATTAAKNLGMNAMLITSGMDSITKAFHDVILLCESLSSLQSENHFLREVIGGQSNETVVFDENRNLYFSTLTSNNRSDVLAMLKNESDNCNTDTPVRLIKSLDGFLYSIKAQCFSSGKRKFTTFYFSRSKAPFSSSKSGIRFFAQKQAQETYYNSFYNSASDIFGLDDIIRQLSVSDRPVMLLGEEGTGKESIAMMLYFKSSIRNHPFISINCALLNSKSWEYLQSSHNSPFAASQITIYLSQIDVLSVKEQRHLLSVLIDMDVCQRNHIIFSCTCLQNHSMPEAGSSFANKLCCLPLQLPSLRDLKDRIPALINLYLSQITISQINEVIGMEDSAIQLMQSFSWPHNLAQFKRVLQELVTTAVHPIITQQEVQKVLLLENSSPIAESSFTPPARFDLNRSLEEMEKEIITRVIDECGGNQTAAAKRLGISRTTLWRIYRQ